MFPDPALEGVPAVFDPVLGLAALGGQAGGDLEGSRDKDPFESGGLQDDLLPDSEFVEPDRFFDFTHTDLPRGLRLLFFRVFDLALRLRLAVEFALAALIAVVAVVFRPVGRRFRVSTVLQAGRAVGPILAKKGCLAPLIGGGNRADDLDIHGAALRADGGCARQIVKAGLAVLARAFRASFELNTVQEYRLSG